MTVAVFAWCTAGDVDMQHRARMRVFVAAHGFTGDPVDMAEPVEPATQQHGVHGRGRHVQAPADLHRAEALLEAQVHDFADQGLRCACRAVMWA
ncbi:hypothetical protein ONO86_05623 [Micromonospora noduli]|nr:hypothetical protein ONO86_05623 [Micromonospora noduli]